MCFKVGDKVYVIAKGDPKRSSWKPGLDQYVNDSNVYVVDRATDHEGECRLNCGNESWWFPVYTLRPAVNPLLAKIEAISAYRYGDRTFANKENLVRLAAEDFVKQFTESTPITEAAISQLIQNMENLKEVCQKLK